MMRLLRANVAARLEAVERTAAAHLRAGDHLAHATALARADAYRVVIAEIDSSLPEEDIG